MGVEEDQFKASNGWYQNFRKRFHIEGTLLHGEGGEVDRNDPTILKELEELMNVIDKFEYKNVYNMDETGLFFRMIPRFTLLCPTEDEKSVRGRKIKKDRITLTVCANADGSHKLDLQLIGKPKTPACIKGKQWPVPYYSQRNAWMDVSTYMKWFDEIFYPAVRLKTRKPVLLLLDNAPGHATEFVRDDVQVKFFPPRVTSWKQPMDMGIIAALKKRYKFLLIKDILAFNDLSPAMKIQ